MQQLVLTTHTGVNLNFPLPDLVEFVHAHAPDGPADPPGLLLRLEQIFSPGPAGGGFLVLGLDEETNALMGLLAMENGATQSAAQHRLVTLVIHSDYRRQGCGLALLRSGKMLSRGQITLDLDPTHPSAAFFCQAGFETAAESLVMKRS
jgi:hypothetical protein